MKKQFLVLVILAVTALAVFTLKPKPKSADFDFLALHDVPNISAEVISANGTDFKIEEPILRNKKTQSLFFEIEIINKNISEEPAYSFTGDADSILAFTRQVKFVKEHPGGSRVVPFISGAGSAIADLFKSVWELIKHPIDSVIALGKGVWAGGVYVAESAMGKHNPYQDFKKFISAYYLNTCEEVSSDFGFSYTEAIIPEARNKVEGIANWKVGGYSTTQLALLFIPFANASKAGEAVEVTRAVEAVNVASKAERAGVLEAAGSDLYKMPNLFTKGEVFANSINRISKFAAIENSSEYFVGIFSSLSNPEKLVTLGERAGNRKMNQMMYWLKQSENSGQDVARIIDQAYEINGGDRNIRKLFHSEKLSRESIMTNYQQCKKLGLFETEENMQSLRRGGSAIITNGEYAGHITHIDHIVPHSLAPEISNQPFNLRYLPGPENLSKSASLDSESFILLKKIADEKILNESKILAIKKAQ